MNEFTDDIRIRLDDLDTTRPQLVVVVEAGDEFMRTRRYVVIWRVISLALFALLVLRWL